MKKRNEIGIVKINREDAIKHLDPTEQVHFTLSVGEAVAAIWALQQTLEKTFANDPKQIEKKLSQERENLTDEDLRVLSAALVAIRINLVLDGVIDRTAIELAQKKVEASLNANNTKQARA